MNQEGPVNLNNILDEAREEKSERDRRRALECARREQQFRDRQRAKERLIAAKILVPATLDDYKMWLQGFLRKGRKPTHYYDYPFKNAASAFFVATSDFELPVLHGAQAIHVIVPHGIRVTTQGQSHSTLYLMDRFSSRSRSWWIPIYSDISF